MTNGCPTVDSGCSSCNSGNELKTEILGNLIAGLILAGILWWLTSKR